MFLIILQIPGLFTVFVHWRYRVRTLWIGGESEVKECRNHFLFRGFDPSTVTEVNLSTCG